MGVIGQVDSLWRYPVKSMAGEAIDEAFVGYAGIFGDRAYAFLNAAAPAGFPYLTGRSRPEMLRYRPRFRDAALAARPVNQSEAERLGPGLTPLYPSQALGVEVTAPSGEVFDIADAALLARLSVKDTDRLSLVHSDRALTDCRPVSLISLATVRQLGEEVGAALGTARFRANIYADLGNAAGFAEDGFVGRRIQLGGRAVVAVLDRDPRCKMLSIDPDTAQENTDVLRNVARAHGGNAGVYGAVLTEGMVRRGDAITLLD
jgi:uncharacterized protein YcbX